MCGIAGIVRRDGKRIDSADLRRMGSAIAHRGPDGAGFALLNRGAVGLGHVRLSIVDLGGGHQPLYNEDHSIAVICNGEIYDYAKLHGELIQQGHRFRTSSDSELIIHLYEQHGVACLDRLNGEYAFLLWDERRKRLIAGKDRCGIKPLYYHVAPNELLLCSEVKGIFALDRVERRISAKYLAGPALGIYQDDASAFENVRSLRPGHYLLLDAGAAPREVEYYRPSFAVREEMTFAEATSEVHERLTVAVSRRLAADVPVNAYLSGGIDSSIVVGLMTRAGAQFTCFNVGFPDSPYDESAKARHIAQHFGQRFETVPCSHERIADNIARAVYCTEMPLHNYNSIAKMLLSAYVRSRGEKVCLTGEGADELFAGYPYFKLEMLWRMQLQGGAAAQQSLELQKKFRVLEKRSEGLLWQRGERWKKATGIFGYPSFFNMRTREANRCVKMFYDIESLGLSRADFPDNVLRHSVSAERRAGLNPFNVSRLISFNQLYSLVIPALGDRVEMANSLECRPPFLDRDLLEFVGTIPPRHFIDIERLREKNLLREAFRDLLPPVFETEHKHPFLSPTWSSFARTKAGRGLFSDFLSSAAVRKAGIFRPQRVALARLALQWLPLRRGFARKIDAFLGGVLTTHLLHHQFIENRIPCDPSFPMWDRSPERVGAMSQAA